MKSTLEVDYIWRTFAKGNIMAKVKEQSVAYTTKKKSSARTLLAKPKHATMKMLQDLKDDATYEDIMYKVYVLDNIQKGMEDVERGRVVSHAEVKKRLKRWLA